MPLRFSIIPLITGHRLVRPFYRPVPFVYPVWAAIVLLTRPHLFSACSRRKLPPVTLRTGINRVPRSVEASGPIGLLVPRLIVTRFHELDLLFEEIPGKCRRLYLTQRVACSRIWSGNVWNAAVANSIAKLLQQHLKSYFAIWNIVKHRFSVQQAKNYFKFDNIRLKIFLSCVSVSNSDKSAV